MRKLIDWLKESNRWKHFLGGFIIGLVCNSWYCAVLVGACTGSGMEFKDYQWGGEPDWKDFVLTFAGTLIGYGIISFIF